MYLPPATRVAKRCLLLADLAANHTTWDFKGCWWRLMATRLPMLPWQPISKQAVDAQKHSLVFTVQLENFAQTRPFAKFAPRSWTKIKPVLMVFEWLAVVSSSPHADAPGCRAGLSPTLQVPRPWKMVGKWLANRLAHLARKPSWASKPKPFPSFPSALAPWAGISGSFVGAAFAEVCGEHSNCGSI